MWLYIHFFTQNVHLLNLIYASSIWWVKCILATTSEYLRWILNQKCSFFKESSKTANVHLYNSIYASVHLLSVLWVRLVNVCASACDFILVSQDSRWRYNFIHRVKTRFNAWRHKQVSDAKITIYPVGVLNNKIVHYVCSYIWMKLVNQESLMMLEVGWEVLIHCSGNFMIRNLS